MKTINEIKKLAHLKNNQSVYYRIKASGIEDKKDYKPTYEMVNGKPGVRIFSDEEAKILIYFKLN